MGLILRVLSGPHQGAEVELLDEAVTIGSADTCDVILGDALVASEHAQFQLQGEQVFITPKEGNVFVNGKLLREPSLVDVFQFVTIGATHMMFGEASDERWTTLALDRFPELEKIEEKVSKFEGEEGIVAESEGADGEQSGASDEVKSDVDGKELEERKGNAADGIGKDAKIRLTFKQRMIRYFWGSVICFLVALAVSIGYVIKRDTPSAVETKEEPLELRVQEVLDSLKMHAKLKVNRAEDGSVSVIGYVDTMADSAKIKQAVTEVSDAVAIKLQNMEKILSSANELVQESKQSVTLETAEEFGEIVATGYIRKAEIWANLKGEITSIKGITKLIDDVLTKDTAIERAEKVLEEFGLKDKLEVKPTDEGVEIGGTIADSDKESWAKAREALTKAFKKRAQLNFQVNVSTDRNLTIEKFFGGKIDSVNFSEEGLDWVNLKNGNKYFQGSVLPSGYIIDHIEQNSVTIKNADEIITLDFDWV